MNERDFQAWADKIDNRPSYGSRTAGRINFMLFPGELVERRSYKPCFPRLERRRTQLLLMRARMDAEERFGS